MPDEAAVCRKQVTSREKGPIAKPEAFSGRDANRKRFGSRGFGLSTDYVRPSEQVRRLVVAGFAQTRAGE